MTQQAYPATIAGRVERELVVKKSRFIAVVAPVASTDEADQVIAGERQRWWDAGHNCQAQVTGIRGDRARSSDDGEPSGTAGVPMLEVLHRRQLTDVIAVVSRYFGGVKLGAGGLVRAYSSAVSEALDLAEIVQRMLLARVAVEVPHAEAGRFDHVLREWALRNRAVLGETEYASAATFSLWVPTDAVSALMTEVAASSAGTVDAVETGEERVVDVPFR